MAILFQFYLRYFLYNDKKVVAIAATGEVYKTSCLVRLPKFNGRFLKNDQLLSDNIYSIKRNYSKTTAKDWIVCFDPTLCKHFGAFLMDKMNLICLLQKPLLSISSYQPLNSEYVSLIYIMHVNREHILGSLFCGKCADFTAAVILYNAQKYMSKIQFLTTFNRSIQLYVEVWYQVNFIFQPVLILCFSLSTIRYYFETNRNLICFTYTLFWLLISALQYRPLYHNYKEQTNNITTWYNNVFLFTNHRSAAIQ